MSRRRRRRHADPAQLPRHDPVARQSELRRKDERERAARELVRVDDALARATAVTGAAIVYFGVWVVNTLFGLFPAPVGIDLTHPQFLIGVGALVASLFAARYLVRSARTRRLMELGVWSSVVFGAVVLLLVALFVTTLSGSETFAFIVAGMGISWFMVTLWVALLSRRAGRLLAQVGDSNS